MKWTWLILTCVLCTELLLTLQDTVDWFGFIHSDKGDGYMATILLSSIHIPRLEGGVMAYSKMCQIVLIEFISANIK